MLFRSAGGICPPNGLFLTLDFDPRSQPSLQVLRTDGLDLAQFTTEDHLARLPNQRVPRVVVRQGKHASGGLDDPSQGFGLRAVSGEATGYAHSTELSEKAINRAAATVQAVRAGHDGAVDETPQSTNRALYSDANPLSEIDFAAKVKLLADIDAYARDSDTRVRQVMASLTGEWQAVAILRQGGVMMSDVRPLVRLSVTVMVGEGERMESGSHGVGGRCGYQAFMTPENWQSQVDEALRQALVNLESIAAPAGEMPVVLGPGWPGILLHEAIGHGLEGERREGRVVAWLAADLIVAVDLQAERRADIDGRRQVINYCIE